MRPADSREALADGHVRAPDRAQRPASIASAAGPEGPSPSPSSSPERPISIALSQAQVDQVVRSALGTSVRDGLLPASSARTLHDIHVRQALSERYRSLQGNRRLSRSLLAGLLVLSCFAVEGAELGIKEISDELQLNSSTVHRYVATLLAAGLLERDPDTRRYRLLAG